MTEYESSGFEPPAPVSIVTLRNPHNGKLRTDVQMLLDTGADVSLVPASTLNELELRPDRDRSYEILGFDGRSSFACVARLEIIFCGRSFRGQFLLVDQNIGVLGRNVLNRLCLLFDGPALRWEDCLDR